VRPELARPKPLCDKSGCSARSGSKAPEPVFSGLPPLALYVHFPWCVRKCPYCDFNSHAVRGGLEEQDLLDALIHDLVRESRYATGRRLESVFIGGGTPSLMSSLAVRRLWDAIRNLFELRRETEITLEANPGVADGERFHAYREAGVTRLSLGVQTLSSPGLSALGRIHDADQARRAMELAMVAGYSSVNVDLMFGIPQQDIAAARRDLKEVIGFGPGHVSYYQLTLEPNTPFFNDPPELPTESVIVGIQSMGEQVLESAGLAQYEVSAYARRGVECRHNINYWEFGDYLGVGPGAHGKVTRLESQHVERRWKQRHPRTYITAAGGDQQVAGQRRLEAWELPLEFSMNAFRLLRGFSSDLFEARTGLPFDLLQPAIHEAKRKGLVELAGERVRASALGRRFLNDLLELFIP